MVPESPAMPDVRQINRGINVARVLAIGLALLPLVPLVFGMIIATQTSATPEQNPALFDSIRSYTYGSVVTSCLLIPLVAIVGLRLTFRKRAITQQVERGRIFLSSLVVGLMYAFLTVALFILWNLTPDF